MSEACFLPVACRAWADHHSGSARSAAIQANGASDAPMNAGVGEAAERSSSPSPDGKQKWSLANGSSEQSDLEYDDMSHSPAVDGLVVSGTGVRNSEMGGVDADDGQISTDKNADRVGSPTLVFTQPPSGMMHTAQLYHPGSGQPLR